VCVRGRRIKRREENVDGLGNHEKMMDVLIPSSDTVFCSALSVSVTLHFFIRTPLYVTITTTLH